MACESARRQSVYLKIGCNAYHKRDPTSQPMSFWTEQDVLAYLKMTGIPYASVYGEIVEENGRLTTTGAKRTGCMFCMFGVHLEKKPNRFQRMALTHPKGDSTKAPYLALEYATNTNILRFKKIVAEANPFDERWNGYYEERDGEKMLNSTKGREKLLKLWRNQKHLCPVCNEPITSETSFKVHKIFENGTYRKSMMVHPLCHNKLHNSAVFSFESGFREEALRKA